MNLGSLRLSKTSTAYLIVSVVVLIAFLFMPWVSVMGYFSPTAASALFRISNLMSLGESYGASFNGVDVVTILYCILLYGIIVPIALAAFQLFVGHDLYKFDNYCRIGFWVDIAEAVGFIVIRFIFLRYVESAINSSYYGYGGLASSILSGFLSFGLGFYIITFAGIIGVILPYVIKEAPNANRGTANSVNVNADVKQMFDAGKNFIKGTTSRITGRSSESTGDLLPAVVLSNDRNKIKVGNFPATIGRNREEVDHYVFDNTISRKHAQLQIYEGALVIADLGTVYGTYINNDKLEPNEYYEVLNGDIIKIGDIPFQVEINEVILNEKAKAAQPVRQPVQNQGQVDMYIDPMNGQPVQEVNITEQKIEPEIEIPQELDKTVFLGSDDYNQTVALDYNGGNGNFPIMTLRSAGNGDLYIVNKTPFIIGADAERSDLQLKKRGVSKQHVNIQRIDNVFYISDLGSTNGTKLNGTALRPNEHYPLNTGDVITIGEIEYVFEDA